jgi:hypothetical protein
MIKACTTSFVFSYLNLFPIGALPAEVLFAPKLLDQCKLFASRSKQVLSHAGFTMYGDGVSEQLRLRVLDGLKDGGSWRTGYKLPSPPHIIDNSAQLSSTDQLAVKAKLQKDIDAGFVQGPFDAPPLPASWCKGVNMIFTKVFLIPKNKWSPNDGLFRLITDKSTPRLSSINDNTDRADSGQPYYTFASFLAKVRQAGRGSLILLADVPTAYKHIKWSPRDWWQLGIKVGNQFYIDTTGTFGAVAAGDAWNCVAMFIVQVMHNLFNLKLFDVYVDNFDNVTPPLKDGTPDVVSAQSEAETIFKVLGDMGVPCHEIQQPTTSIESHLGWAIDTIAWEVSVTPQRMDLMSTLLQEWISRKRFFLRDLRSLVGLFNFVATVILCLKPSLGHLIQVQTKIEAILRRGKNSPHKGWKITDQIKAACAWLAFLLDTWSGIVPISAPLRTLVRHLYVDACQTGAGAFLPKLMLFFSYIWPQFILDRAYRDVTLSMPFLEAYCLVMAVNTFPLSGVALTIHTDCEPVELAFNKRYSPDSELLSLIHILDVIAMNRHLEINIIHIAGDLNTDADLTSRSNIQEFKRRHKGANLTRVHPTHPQRYHWPEFLPTRRPSQPR